MARQIVWTAPAEKDRKDILAYWIKRNGTPTYSLKLLDRFDVVISKMLSIRSLADRRTSLGSVCSPWPTISSSMK